MYKKTLKCLVEDFKGGDMGAFPQIYGEFERLIYHYSKKLDSEDVRQELTLFLIELLYKIEVSSSEGIKKYIAVCLRNKYIYLSKQKQLGFSLIDKVAENYDTYCDFCEDTVLLKELISKLPIKQREVIVYKYIYSYSDIEIAEIMNISRQAVNRIKNRALCGLREYI